MDSTKNLKASSGIVLGLAILSLINILYELFFGELSGELNGAAIPDGSPENVILITQVFVAVVSLIMLLPQFYVGIKGLKVAAHPDDSKTHIVWGIILIVFTGIGLLSPLLAFLQGDGDAFANVSEFLSITVDFSVLIAYVKFAIAVRNGC